MSQVLSTLGCIVFAEMYSLSWSFQYDNIAAVSFNLLCSVVQEFAWLTVWFFNMFSMICFCTWELVWNSFILEICTQNILQRTDIYLSLRLRYLNLRWKINACSKFLCGGHDKLIGNRRKHKHTLSRWLLVMNAGLIYILVLILIFHCFRFPKVPRKLIFYPRFLTLF